MIEHEFDRIDCIEDDFQNINSAEVGIWTASYVLEILNQEKRQYNFKTMLGLGAGYANAEIAFARSLNLQPELVTFIDKGVEDSLITEAQNRFTGTNYINKTGIFTYLAQSKAKYDLVTLFGCEYIFFRRTSTEIFFRDVSKIINKNGVLIIMPFNEADIQGLYRSLGFETLVDSFSDYYRPIYLQKVS